VGEQPENRVSHQPLTPTAFLERSATVWADRPAVVDGDVVWTYAAFYDAAKRLARVLHQRGVTNGDRVAVLGPNRALLLTAHYAVPYAQAVLVALNHRLSEEEITAILAHSGARLLLVDGDFADRVPGLAARNPNVELLVGGASGTLDDVWAGAAPLAQELTDENALLALNYTSGTTGAPKGVMYTHRGAYLQSLAMAYHTQLDTRSVMLWTLPMFHCNGWCFTWAATAAGATHLCLPAIDTAVIWQLIRNAGVTHLNGAPTVLTMIVNDPDAANGPAPQTVRVASGGAPPSPTLLKELSDRGFAITHLYGLTETYGPAAICEWQPSWDDADDVAVKVSRQGFGNIVSEQLRVIDSDGNDVPWDASTIGEVAIRGNNVMTGYYNDAKRTAEVVRDGWFYSGDLGVIHPDGYIELRDRAKDVIISGGENITSVEVEQALLSHPAVLECAVVAAKDNHWGEVPVAYVSCRRGHTVTQQELVDHVRNQIARYKAPRAVVFREDLPKTSTGKIQKHVLRVDAAKDWAIVSG
jgi:fatty-acyl-CoA synthase